MMMVVVRFQMPEKFLVGTVKSKTNVMVLFIVEESYRVLFYSNIWPSSKRKETEAYGG